MDKQDTQRPAQDADKQHKTASDSLGDDAPVTSVDGQSAVSDVEATASESDPGSANSSNDQDDSVPSSSRPKAGRWVAVVSVLGVLLALAALALAGLLYRQLQVAETQYGSQLSRLSDQLQQTGQVLGEADSRQRQLQQQQQELRQDLQQSLENSRQQLQDYQRQLNQLAGSDRQDWLLAEVEYLLRLANQRLNLERDPEGARAMLEAADQVLQENDNPAFDAVRTELAQEIQALRLVPGIDRTGAVARLQAMQDGLGNVNWLPLANTPTTSVGDSADTSTAAESRPWYQQLWQEITSGLAQVVHIRRQDTPVDIPLSPEQSYYLQQNARLMLEQAQLAILRRDQVLYDRSLQRVSDWIARYLPPGDPTTQELTRLADELGRWQVAPVLPDISGSLQRLRDRMSQTGLAVPLSGSQSQANDAAETAPSAGEQPIEQPGASL